MLTRRTGLWGSSLLIALAAASVASAATNQPLQQGRRSGGADLARRTAAISSARRTGCSMRSSVAHSHAMRSLSMARTKSPSAPVGSACALRKMIQCSPSQTEKRPWTFRIYPQRFIEGGL